MPDFTPGSFAAFCAHLVGEVEDRQREALERAAKIVQAEAKREIGEYQPDAGQFAAWRELADATKEDRVAQGFTENDPLLRTGALRDSIEWTVQNKVAYVGSNSEIAEYQELGTSRIPPRSFLGGALVRKTDEVVQVIGEDIYAALTGTQSGVDLSAAIPNTVGGKP